MSLQDINIGAAPNDKTGTPARQAGQMINQNFHYLEGKIVEMQNPDVVLKKGDIETDGLDVHVDVGAFEWRIAQIDFLDNPAFNAVLDAATDGYYRKDLLLGDNNGVYHIFKGDEDPVSASEPNLIPNGTIKLGVIDVYGASIDGTEPVDLSGYATKDELALEIQNRAYADDDLNARVSSTENAITDLEENKLNIADYNDRFKGVYPTELALNIAHPTANSGDYAQVNEVGSTVVVNFNWDSEDNVWVEGGSGGSGATNTDMLPEGASNLYFTTARVLAVLLSGVSFLTGGAIVPTDSVLVAFGKLQKQITDIIAGTLSVFTNNKNVYIDINGNDSTGLIGRIDKPFLTINAALDALGSAGGILNIGIGTFSSPLYSKIKSNTVFKGSGKPEYNNVITGGTPYPNYSKTTATALVGGTIFLGEFRIPALSENIQIYDLGVDCGPDWCLAFNGNVAADAMMISNGDYVNTSQNGKVLRKNVVVKNVSTIVKGSSDMVHSFNLENCFEPYVDNIDVYNGFAGFVYKNIGGTAQNIKASNSGSYGIIIKTNSYAYAYSMTLRGFEIDGGAGMAIHDEGGVVGDVQEITVLDGKIRNTSFGVKQIGNQLRYLKLSNIIVSKLSGIGYEFADIVNSNFLNCSAILCTGIGFSIRGTNTRISECRSTSNTTFGFDVRCLTAGSPMIFTGNDANSNGSYGFFYTGDVRGGHNVATLNTTGASTGNIALIEIPLNLSGAPGSYLGVLNVENTGTSATDKNAAIFAGNRGSSSSTDDNTTIGIRQKNTTVKNYSVFGFFNSAFSTVAQIATRNLSHTDSNGYIVFYTSNGGSTLILGMVLSSLGNLLIGKDQFTGVTNNDNGQKLQVEGTMYLKEYTVATLPTPSGSFSAYATVTDATSPTYLGALTGGGSVKCPVFYNGTAWVSH